MVRNFTKIIVKNNIRIYLSDFTDVVNQILNYHQYKPFPNLILANAITALSPIKFLYDTNNLMVRIKTNGAIKSLILEIKNNNVRSLIANPNIETEYDNKNFNSIPLILGIGDHGIFEVSREIKNEIFRSETQMVKFDIVTDLAYYLNVSDQIFSAVVNDVLLDENNSHQAIRAKNIIFQMLPSHTEEDKIWVENFIKKYPLKEYSILDIEKLIDGEVLDIKQIDGSCWCSKEKVIAALNLLDKKEIEEMFKDNKNIEVVCDFCQTKNEIFRKDLD